MKSDVHGQIVKPLSLVEYAEGLSRNGRTILPGATGSCWVRYDRFAMIRMPFFCQTSPTDSEIRRVLWKSPAAVASYYLQPNEQFPANVYLYVCADRSYRLEILPPAMRRNVRRGIHELRIERIDAETLMMHGSEAFRDTLRRNGLQEKTPEEFRHQIAQRAKFPGHIFIGAWKDHTLAAYLSLVDVEDWVEITTCVSADALLQYRPNDALMFYTLSHYLVDRGYRAVTFGSSSIQQGSNRASLHTFKTKVGFQPVPLHRAFVVHPCLRPLANQLIWRGMNAALRYAPGNLRLRKAAGVLECIAGRNRIWAPQTAVQVAEDRN